MGCADIDAAASGYVICFVLILMLLPQGTTRVRNTLVTMAGLVWKATECGIVLVPSTSSVTAVIVSVSDTATNLILGRLEKRLQNL